MGKELPPESPESAPSVAPSSGRREKISGINVRPDFIQPERLDEAKRGRIISEIGHNINNPLSVFLAGLEYIQAETHVPQEYVRSVFTFYKIVHSRIERIMERSKPSCENPISFEEVARSLTSMQIDIISLKTSFDVCLPYVDTYNADLFEVCEDMAISHFRLSQRTKEAINRVESANPDKEFAPAPFDASLATNAALVRVGWRQPVQKLSTERVCIATAIEPLSVVFENIIINAKRYGGDLQIFAVVLRFEDDGPGFVDDPSRLFEIFVQGERGSKSGFGVGMSACKHIMDMMHGEISAENMLDEEGNVCGARITLRFPVIADFSG